MKNEILVTNAFVSLSIWYKYVLIPLYNMKIAFHLYTGCSSKFSNFCKTKSWSVYEFWKCANSKHSNALYGVVGKAIYREQVPFMLRKPWSVH